jgi:hypothetical protein
MPIPELDSRGFLPHGVHDASLGEVLERFGRFRETDRRQTLAGQLVAFMEEARRTGLVASVIVDGSFATSKPQPAVRRLPRTRGERRLGRGDSVLRSGCW